MASKFLRVFFLVCGLFGAFGVLTSLGMFFGDIITLGVTDNVTFFNVFINFFVDALYLLFYWVIAFMSFSQLDDMI